MANEKRSSDYKTTRDGDSKPQTTSSERINKDGKTSWINYDGTKNSRNVEATQYNIKDNETGAHIYYNYKSGSQGNVGGFKKEKSDK